MKNALLRGLGHQIDPAAPIGPNLVWKVERFTVGEGGRILSSNVFKGLRTASVGKNAHIGCRNHITASAALVRHSSDRGDLILAANPSPRIAAHLTATAAFVSAASRSWPDEGAC